MNLRGRQQEQTRVAILDALAEVIADAGAFGFSIQDVADRAGVTHRTVYNHFPTREALNDAFAVHVEVELGKVTELLTEHQGLSNEDAARTAEWATKTFGRRGERRLPENRRNNVSQTLMIEDEPRARVLLERSSLSDDDKPN